MFGTPTFRQQFPIFQHHPTLVYLDSAATTQKPQVVIDGITNFYQKENANIHRGIYDLAAKATQKYERPDWPGGRPRGMDAGGALREGGGCGGISVWALFSWGCRGSRNVDSGHVLYRTLAS